MKNSAREQWAAMGRKKSAVKASGQTGFVPKSRAGIGPNKAAGSKGGIRRQGSKRG